MMSFSTSIPARLQQQQETIFALIEGTSESHLKRRFLPDKWSAFENIVHLAAYQVHFLYRLDLILKENDPSFERYVAERDPLFYDYMERPLHELRADLVEKRMILTEIFSVLEDTAWERQGSHPKYGRLSISQWAEFFLLHEAHHLYTLFALIQEGRNRGWQ